MRSLHCCAAAIALLLVVNTSLAQQTDDAVAPFVNDETLVITRIELARVDPSATLDWLVDRVKQQGLDQASCDMLRRWWKPSFDKWGGLMADARDAAVKRAYWLLTLQDLLARHDPRGVWVFPLDAPSNAQKVIDSLRTRGLEAQRIGDAVIGSRPGRGMPQNSTRGLPQAWAKALAGGQETIRIIFMPTQVLRKSFEQNVPGLPLGKALVPITTLTRGIEWISVSAELPPKPEVRMTIQGPAATAAQAIAKLAEQTTAVVRAERDQLVPPIRALAELARQTPTTVGDQVRWEPDFDKIVMPIVIHEITLAARQRSAANLKQIMMGLVMYANNQNGQTPPDLDALVKDQEMSPQVLVDPLNPKERIGFVYIRPVGNWNEVPRETAVVYEATSEGNNLGFADAHVEWVATRKEVEDFVKAAQARNRAAGEGKK